MAVFSSSALSILDPWLLHRCAHHPCYMINHHIFSFIERGNQKGERFQRSQCLEKEDTPLLHSLEGLPWRDNQETMLNKYFNAGKR